MKIKVRSSYDSRLDVTQLKMWARDVWVEGRGLVAEMCWEAYYSLDWHEAMPSIYGSSAREIGFVTDDDGVEIPFTDICSLEKAINKAMSENEWVEM